jgi:hypothetical protein
MDSNFRVSSHFARARPIDQFHCKLSVTGRIRAQCRGRIILEFPGESFSHGTCGSSCLASGAPKRKDVKTKYTLRCLILAIGVVSLFSSREFLRSSATAPSIAAHVRDKLQPPLPVPVVISEKETSAGIKQPDANSELAANALALSSFLPNSAVLGLDADTCARLEVYLQDARRVTYGLLVESGAVSKMPDGRIRIVISSQSSMANDIKNQVYSSIESIVGKDAMKQMRETLGPRFDAQFAYFGEYDTAIDLSIDRTPNSNEYVTMASAYAQVKLLGLSKSNIRSTSVERKDRFESQFFSLASLKSTARGS